VTAALPPALEPIKFEVRLLHARLDRAEEHYQSFGRIWAEYLDQRPHALDRTVEPDGTIVARLRRVTPLPAELSVVFGELLYELRAVLDNCLYAVAVLVSGQNPPPSASRLEWPNTCRVGESAQKTGTDGLSTCSPRVGHLARIRSRGTRCGQAKRLQRRTRLPCLGRASAVGLVAWQAASRSPRRSGLTSIWLCSVSVPS
jgi:hypothetical protein